RLWLSRCVASFFVHRPPSPHISTLSLHAALPICFNFHVKGVARPYRSRPAQLLDPHADQSAGDMNLALGHQSHGDGGRIPTAGRSEEHTSELQSRVDVVCSLLLEIHNK